MDHLARCYKGGLGFNGEGLDGGHAHGGNGDARRWRLAAALGGVERLSRCAGGKWERLRIGCDG